MKKLTVISSTIITRTRKQEKANKFLPPRP